MPPKRARKEESEEDSGKEDSVEETPALNKSPASGTVTVPVPDKQTDAEGNTYFEISGKRRVTVRSFNGLKLVDIREMYTDRASGDLKPGKKGISLSEEQFMGLVNVHGAITQALNDLDVGASSSSTRASKAKATKSKAAPSKPAAKKKARKEESDEE